MLRALIRATLAASALLCTPAGLAQTPLDRIDPSVVEEELRRREKAAPDAKPPLVLPQPQAGPAAGGGDFVVGAILIDGASELSAADFAGVIERYTGRRLGQEQLRVLAGEIADVARAAGFGLATAAIPQQRINNGILRVILDEGRIDEIRARGSAAAAVNRMLAPLADGRPVRTARLERQLLLAGELPGVRLGAPRIDRRGGRTYLRLRADRDPSRGRAYLDNWGSESVGPGRAQLIGDLNGIVGGNDQLTLGVVVTLPDPQDFGLISAGYSTLLGRGGTKAHVRAYLARSRPGARFGNVEGDSREVAIGLGHYLRRTRVSRIRADIELAVRSADQDRAEATLRKDRLATLSAGASAFGKLGPGRGRARLALVQGLALFDATREGDPLASRRDGSGVFTKLEFSGHYDQPLGRGFSAQVDVEGQIASRALLASEEMGLGGRYFLRGYDYREVAGDDGYAASVELRYDLASPPSPPRAAQLYGYADGGIVSNRANGLGGGSLASAGAGFRLWLGKVEGSLELGIPLGGKGDRRREPRLSLTLGTRF